MTRNAPGSTPAGVVVPVNAAGTTVRLAVLATSPGPVAVTTVSPGARPATTPVATVTLAIVVSPVANAGAGTPGRGSPLASLYAYVYVAFVPDVIVPGPPEMASENGTVDTNMVSLNPPASAATHTGVAANATPLTKNAGRTCGASDARRNVATPVLQEVTVTAVVSGLPKRARRTTKERDEAATTTVRASSSNVRLFGVPTSVAVGSSLQAATRARAASAPCRPKIREFMRSSLDGLPAVTQKRWTSCSASGPSNSCQLERLGSRRSSV